MLRKWAADASIALGTVWTWAGAARMIFGIRITLPIFPAVDLSRVDATPALLVGLGLVVLGAWLKRGVAVEERDIRARLDASKAAAALPGQAFVDARRERVETADRRDLLR